IGVALTQPRQNGVSHRQGHRMSHRIGHRIAYLPAETAFPWFRTPAPLGRPLGGHAAQAVTHRIGHRMPHRLRCRAHPPATPTVPAHRQAPDATQATPPVPPHAESPAAASNSDTRYPISQTYGPTPPP